MAPALRSSTQVKTNPGTEAAKRTGYNHRPRKPAHNKHYPSTKGLVNLKRSKGLQHITNANADSPLLRLPPEIRNMIFEMTIRDPGHIRLLVVEPGQLFLGGYFRNGHKVSYEHVAFNLP